ncbi:ABC transporter substrate-binding protein [Rhodococcus sp. IEGM 1318]|uniref:ABC transporter substrate-binding protein n=1 Tax=Rhodococcus sp. IEGM 1318 TaxID=3082226 RepID=UPI002955DDE8|nr:ABC transporter substrate-binding protein [Rhodococcus sp. IEGM 1318]MDV8009373.1 ABC transporter substrate-binding protein [Rhodococcus sp. IEGM 1318]
MNKKLAHIAGVSAAVILTMALSSCGSNGGNDDGTVAIGIYPASVLSLPAFIGDKAGIFKNHDLTVDLIDGKSGPELTSALLGGTTQIALGTPPTVIPAVQQGQKLLSVPPYGGIDSSVAATAASGIATLADLSGKRVAVPARGGAAEQYVTELLKEQGIDPATVTFIAAGPSNAQVPIVRKGDVDAVVLSYASLTVFENEGLSLKVIANPADGSAGDVGRYALGSFFMTTQKVADNSPTTLRSVCSAFFDIAAWMQNPANAPAGADIVAEITGLPVEAAADIYNYEASLWSETLDDERWKQNVDWVVSNLGGQSQAPAPLTSACT